MDFFQCLCVFYCINTSYSMDNCKSNWHTPAHQMTKKPSFVSTGRTDPVVHIRQVAHHTFFLSRQHDVIPSFSYGVCTVQMDFGEVLRS